MTATVRRDRRRSADGQVLGALLVLAGVGWLVQRSGLADITWQMLLSALLIVLGVGLVVTARLRGGSGLVLLGIAMTVALASTSSLEVGALKGGVGDRLSTPRTVAQAEATDALGVGHLQVDLRDLEVPEGKTTELTYTMAIGEMDITLPDDIPVRVRATMQGGDVQVLDRNESGDSIDLRAEDPDFADATTRIDLRVTMGFGNLQVNRAPQFRLDRAPF